MYKVFINDKVICFESTDSEHLRGKKRLPERLDPHQIADYVNQQPSSRIRNAFVHLSDQPDRSFRAFLRAFTVIRAAGGVVRKNNEKGKILMIFRLGKWDLPKGKIDRGEQKRKAALREVEEECGIADLKITNPLPDMYHLYKIKDRWVVKETFWYGMISHSQNEPVPQVEEGILKVEWLTPAGVKKILPKAYASIADLLKTAVL